MVGPKTSNNGRLSRTGKKNSGLKLVCFITGIVGSLLMYGILQERIMSEPFGKEEEQFKFSLLLVLANRVLTFVVALLFLLVQKQEIRPKAPLYSYAAVSASNVLATTCQYEALKHVTLPVQTLGKCAKMIPVMVWGAFILRKSYSTKDYSRAVLVTAGCTLFLTSGEVIAKQAEGSYSNLWGVILMTGYLACDGFTSTFQSRLFKGYKMTVYNQILYTTLFSAAYSFLGLLTSGQLPEAVEFLRRHPKVLGHITLLSASSTSGQLFIVHTIQSFGPLLFATIMTSRQFGTILLSCLIFHHPLSKRQWLGTLAVFAAILHKVLEKKKPGPQLSRVGFSEAKLVHGGIAGQAHHESK